MEYVNCGNSGSIETLVRTFGSAIPCVGTFRASSSSGGNKPGSLKFNDEDDSAYRSFVMKGGGEAWNNSTTAPTSITKIHLRWDAGGTGLLVLFTTFR